MIDALVSLNYLAVLVVAIIGFVIGWLWYSVLCGKAWMAEMKLTEEAIAACKPKMGRILTTGFVLTLVSTFGLAWLLRAHGSATALSGAEFGGMVGLLVVGVRFLNGGLWEGRTVRLLAITVGHEVVLYAAQGAILAVWR
jgi:hypothetical protein